MEAGRNDIENTAAHAVEPGPAGGAPAAAGSPARAVVLEAGDHLVWGDGPALRTCPIVGEWTTIGRSASAHIRFEDPTVSRRHALVVRRPDGLRLVDDRSLNGIRVNGRRVEMHTLRDGDRIQVGRHTLYFVHVAAPTPLARVLPAEALPV